MDNSPPEREKVKERERKNAQYASSKMCWYSYDIRETKEGTSASLKRILTMTYSPVNTSGEIPYFRSNQFAINRNKKY